MERLLNLPFEDGKRHRLDECGTENDDAIEDVASDATVGGIDMKKSKIPFNVPDVMSQPKTCPGEHFMPVAYF